MVTAHYVGLGQLDDGPLLDAVEGHYDVLVTCDQGFPWQQQFGRRSVALALLVAPSNDIGDLLPLVPALLAALNVIQPGDVRVVS